MNLYSTREAAERLKKSPRRIQQLGRQNNVGQMISGVRVFSGADLRILRGRKSSAKVTVEMSLDSEVFESLKARAEGQAMDIFLSNLLSSAFAPDDKQR